MEFGCPVCNGFTDLNLYCPKCNETMEDEGSLDNFLGPYSPYEEHDLLHMTADDWHSQRCVHLLQCEKCGEKHRVGIERVRM